MIVACLISDLLIPLNIYDKDRSAAHIYGHWHGRAVNHGGTGYIGHIDGDFLVMAAFLLNNIDSLIDTLCRSSESYFLFLRIRRWWKGVSR